MITDRILEDGLTFDDLLLVPAKSEVIPKDVDVRTQLTQKIRLNIPVISAAMDSVTEFKTAVSMAQEGGLGIIHKNLSIQEQAQEVDRVKRSESGMITNPITVSPKQLVRDALELMAKYHISGVPVTERGILEGILTNRDLRFETNSEQPVSEVMTKGRDKLVTVRKGIVLSEAKRLLHKHRIEKLLVVDESYCLTGLITIKDIEKARKFPFSSKDSSGRLIVGAAVGVGKDREERVQALVDSGVDIIIVDTAHGHSKNVLDSVKQIRNKFPDLDLVAGNVATAEGTEALIRAGVNAVKVGIGPGSICTTRVISGVGVPQMTAIFNSAKVAARHNIPIIADGGIKYSGDMVKALAGGASCIMIGSLFAGTDETPGKVILYQGRRYKQYRGMGSIGAMKEGSSDRYFQEELEEAKLVPEGVEGRVPYKGPLSETLHQLVGGLRSGMGYTGCENIPLLQKKSQFMKISSAALQESHVHDVMVTEEAPNYRREN